MTMVLGISSALARPALALAEAGQELGSVAAEGWPASLLSLLRELLGAVSHRPDAGLDELEAVAVATGPGRYTSLRSGVAFAKGLSAARGLPLVGVPTVAAMAAAAGLERGGVLIPAGRGRFYFTRLGDADDQVATLEADRMPQVVAPGDSVAGEPDQALSRALERAGACCRPVAPEAAAAAVARLGQGLLDGVPGPAVWGAVPQYVSPPIGGAPADRRDSSGE
jgi:tRNA threonylcarbamoyladenosine biosynthesis protein TsaB